MSAGIRLIRIRLLAEVGMIVPKWCRMLGLPSFPDINDLRLSEVDFVKGSFHTAYMRLLLQTPAVMVKLCMQMLVGRTKHISL